MEQHNEKAESLTVKEQVDDILVSVSWGVLARDYFGKSASWFFHRMNGEDEQGTPAAFTEEEKEQLKRALLDLADRIRRTAEHIR